MDGGKPMFFTGIALKRSGSVTVAGSLFDPVNP
jgi:hypothetical protein